MAPNESPSSKKTTVDPAKYDLNSVMPYLLAAQNNPTINYKIMAALDSQGRTHYAFEKQFRKWRATAKQLIDDHPELFNGAGAPVKKTPVKKMPATKPKASGKAAKDMSDDDDESNSDPAKPESPKKRAAIEDAVTLSPSKKAKPGVGKKGTAKPNLATYGKPTNGGDAVVKTESRFGDEVETEMEFE